MIPFSILSQTVVCGFLMAALFFLSYYSLI